MITVYCNGEEVTELMTSTNWSGDQNQAARKVDIGIAASPTDYYLPKIVINMGDLIVVKEDGKEIFQGYVFFRDKSISGDEMNITAYDGLIYLVKSKETYNFKSMTPDAITTKVCSDFGVPIGKLESGSPLNHIFDKVALCEIITTAYQNETNKTGKTYLPRMDKGKLDVIEKGSKLTKFVLDTKTTLIDATYSENMENAVNKVKIYSEEGKELGEVSLPGIPGTLQDIYVKEKGKDAKTQAKELLKPIEKTASIKAVGDTECIAGNSVMIEEPYTGLSGVFYIDTDSHDFSNGQHTMSLGLSFKGMEGE